MKKILSVCTLGALLVSGMAYAEEAPAAVTAKTEAAKAAAPAAEAKKVKMKIKAKIKGDVVKAKVGISHPMLTYNQAKKKGVPVNFIQHITATVNGKTVYDASTSQFLSKNPLIKFQFKSEGVKKGDELKITYVDHTGTYYGSKKIK